MTALSKLQRDQARQASRRFFLGAGRRGASRRNRRGAMQPLEMKTAPSRSRGPSYRAMVASSGLSKAAIMMPKAIDSVNRSADRRYRTFPQLRDMRAQIGA